MKKYLGFIFVAVLVSIPLVFPVFSLAKDKKPIIIGHPNAFSGMMSMYGVGASVGLELAFV